MGSRTRAPRALGQLTIQNRAQTALTAVCAILMSATAGGCVLGHDSDRPVLVVDPLWDVTPGGRFLAGSCDSAEVGFMTWELEDSKGHSLKKTEDLEPCFNSFNFVGLTPGTYRLAISGYTLEEEKRWDGICSKLELRRFDVYYSCPVEQLADDSETDAGVSGDAGDSGAN